MDERLAGAPGRPTGEGGCHFRLSAGGARLAEEPERFAGAAVHGTAGRAAFSGLLPCGGVAGAAAAVWYVVLSTSVLCRLASGWELTTDP